MTGCGSTEQAPPPRVESTTPLLRYMAAKHTVQIDANLTQCLDRHIADDLELSTQTRFGSTQALVRLRVEPDTAQPFTLDLAALAHPDSEDLRSGPGDVVAVNGDGLLVTPIAVAGAPHDSNGGEIIADVTHFPRPVAGDGDRAMTPATHPSPAVSKLFDQTETGRTLKGPEHDAALQRFAQLPRLLLWMLQESEEARELWDRRIKLDTLLATHLVDRDDLLDRMTQSKDGQSAEAIKARLEAVATELQALTKQRDGVDAAMQSNLERLLSERGVGSQQQTIRRSVTLELPDLPPTEILADCRSATDVDNALRAKYPRALEAFDHTRVLVTLDFAPGYGNNASGADAKSSRSQPLAVHYRPAVPATLCVYALMWRHDSDQPVLERVDQQSLSVLNPKTPVITFMLDPQNPSANLVSFDGLGRFSGVRSRAGIAPSQRLSPLLASSPQERVDRCLEHLQSLDVLQNQLGALVRQKELVDSQIALQGETTDASMLSRQARLREGISQIRARLDGLTLNALGVPDTGQSHQVDNQTLLSQLQSQIESLRVQPQTAPSTQP